MNRIGYKFAFMFCLLFIVRSVLCQGDFEFQKDTAFKVGDFMQKNEIKSLQGNDNKLWVGTNNGLFVITESSNQIDFVPSLKDITINKMFIVGSYLYILSFDNKLYQLHTVSRQVIATLNLVRHIKEIKEESVIIDISFAHDKLWVITRNEIYIGSIDSIELLRLKTTKNNINRIYDQIKGTISTIYWGEKYIYLANNNGFWVVNKNYTIVYISKVNGIEHIFSQGDYHYVIQYEDNKRFIKRINLEKLETSRPSFLDKLRMKSDLEYNSFLSHPRWGLIVGTIRGVSTCKIVGDVYKSYNLINSTKMTGGVVYKTAFSSENSLFIAIYNKQNGEYLIKLDFKKKNISIIPKRKIEIEYRKDNTFILNWEFETDSINIKYDEKEQVAFDYMIELMCQDTSLKSIFIEAHTSRARNKLGEYLPRGSVAYLDKLSNQRALVVKKLLIDRLKSCHSNMEIEYKGFADKKPLYKGGKESLERFNRRVVLKFERN